MKNPALLSMTDLAKRLNVTRRTIFNWLQSGEIPIPPIENSKPARWRTVDVDAYIQQHDGEQS